MNKQNTDVQEFRIILNYGLIGVLATGWVHPQLRSIGTQFLDSAPKLGKASPICSPNVSPELSRSHRTTMQPDLHGLEISKGEIKHCSGVSINAVFRPPTFRKFVSELGKTSLVILFICLSGLVLGVIFPENLLALAIVDGIASVILLADDLRKICFSYKNRNLVRIFEDVRRFNSVIKAIDINDQLEEVGNVEVQLKNRERVIHALRLVRDDIIRALKTERILRDNAKFMKLNSSLFEANLTALMALQENEIAGEHGRLLNEALQIVVDVQEEMRKLQNKS